MDFDSQLTDAFSNIGLPLSQQHRVPSEELEQAERRLGLRLPASLRQYYLLAGRHPINAAHNELSAPGELDADGDVLVFMNENQSVVLWGIPTSACAEADPPVVQAPTGGELIWYPEDGSLQNFLLLMLHWQAAMGGLPVSAVGSARSLDLSPGWKVCARVHEMTAFTRPGLALCVVRGTDKMDVFLGALDASVFTAASTELGVAWDYSSADHP